MAPVKTPTRRRLTDGQSGGAKFGKGSMGAARSAKQLRKASKAAKAAKSSKPAPGLGSKGWGAAQKNLKSGKLTTNNPVAQKPPPPKQGSPGPRRPKRGDSQPQQPQQKQQQQKQKPNWDSPKSMVKCKNTNDPAKCQMHRQEGRKQMQQQQQGDSQQQRQQQQQQKALDKQQRKQEAAQRKAEKQARKQQQRELSQQQSAAPEDVDIGFDEGGYDQGGVFDAQPDDEYMSVGFNDKINKSALKRAFNDRSWLEFADPSDLQYKYPGKLGKFIYGFHLLLPALFFLIPFLIHKSMPDIALEVGSGNRSEDDREEVRDDELNVIQKMWQKFSVRQRMLQVVFCFLLIFYGSRFSEEGAQGWRYYYFVVGVVMGVTYLISIFTDQGRGNAYIYLRDHVWPDNRNGAPIEEMKQTCIEFGCGYLPHEKVQSGIKCDEKNRGADVTDY